MSETIQCLRHGIICLHCRDSCRDEIAALKAEQKRIETLLDEAMVIINELSRSLNEHLGFRYYPNGVKNFQDLIERAESFLERGKS